MSERLPSSEAQPPVTHHSHELSTEKNEQESRPELTSVSIKLAEARRNIEAAEQETLSPEASIRQSLENKNTENSPPASRELKLLMLHRTLNKIQRQLPAPTRLLSKAIHQPTIDKLSEVGGKTIARPSGIVSGGLFALVGSIVFVYIIKSGGYRYNYFLFALLFVAGFAVGLIFELGIFLLRRRFGSK